MNYEIVIGLEVHVQLATQSKIFSGAATAFGAEPNTQACAIDLALPGVLPVLNQETIKLAIRLGLAIGANITNHSVFARKNYFYPDLPKGYQISQHDLPIVAAGGSLNITLDDGSQKHIGITRAHLEEDAGKSLHEGLPNVSGVDLNRAGTPLLEIVSEPDMRNAAEAVAYLKTLHQLVRYLEISDGNMQEGSFRVDVNISLRKPGAELGTRAEIKNLNSFRFIERAIAYEYDRQSDILDNGGKITQETRLYDPDHDVTRSMRSKENAPEYRYFPDPDLLPVEITAEFLQAIRDAMPELPWEKCDRLKREYDLNDYDATFISGQLAVAHYFEEALKNASGAKPKLIANWIAGELSAYLNKNNLSIEQSPVNAKQLGELVARIHDQTISNNIAKQVFEAMINDEGSADEIIEKKGLKQITDNSAIEKIIDEIIANNPTQLADYRSGKDKLFGFFVGLAMKETNGKANPQQLNEMLKRKLS